MNVETIGNFVKWAIFELSCNSKIDHRNYDRTKKSSRLQKNFTKLNNFEEAINLTIEKLLKDKEFNSYYSDFEGADNDDEKQDIEFELYNHLINFIGLHEISNLQGCDGDKFRQKFFKTIKN